MKERQSWRERRNRSRQAPGRREEREPARERELAEEDGDRAGLCGNRELSLSSRLFMAFSLSLKSIFFIVYSFFSK